MILIARGKQPLRHTLKSLWNSFFRKLMLTLTGAVAIEQLEMLFDVALAVQTLPEFINHLSTQITVE